MLIQDAQKAPLTPSKIQTKTIKAPVIVNSDEEEDLSPILDLTSRKRKQQPNIIEALSQPQVKIAKKRLAALTIQEPTLEAMSKIAMTQSESDNSIPRAKGDKVKTYLTFPLLITLLSSYLSIFWFQDGAGTTVQTTAATSSMPISIADVLNSSGEPS